MFAGFNLDFKSAPFTIVPNATLVPDLLEKRNFVRNSLSQFIQPNGNLSAAQIGESWFPNVYAHVFLSHSHRDENLAINLANFLYNTFGIVTFIDSCIWGYKNHLLKQIDDEYCLNVDKKTYNYDLRNRSTSHVDVLLTKALLEMIDNTECHFLLNTNQAVNGQEILNHTYSPWIFMENFASTCIRKRSPSEHRGMIKKSHARLDEQNRNLVMEFNIDLSHLHPLTDEGFSDWKKIAEKRLNMNLGFQGTKAHAALDILYKLFEKQDSQRPHERVPSSANQPMLGRR